MTMIKTKKVLLDLDDNPIILDPESKTPATVGKVVAFILQAYKGNVFQNDPLKVLELARSFYKKDEVDLDKSDFTKLQEVVKAEQRFGPIVLGQLVEVFQDALASDASK